MKNGSALLRLAGLAVRRPRLGWAMLRTAWRFRSKGWYRTPPFLPLPSERYLDWRLHTAFGSEGEPDAEALVRYLEWVRAMRPPRA